MGGSDALILSYSCPQHPHPNIRLDVLVENCPQKAPSSPRKYKFQKKILCKARILSPPPSCSHKLSFIGEFREGFFLGKDVLRDLCLPPTSSPFFSDFGKDKNLVLVKTSHCCCGRIQVYFLLFCPGMASWAQRGEEQEAPGK